MFLTVFATLVVIYIALVIVMARYQDKLVFHPGKRDAFAKTVDRFAVVTTLTADNITLKGFYCPPLGQKPVIMYFHGNAGDASDRVYKAKNFIAEGYGFLFAEYHGFGGNPGFPGEDEFYHDARAWLSFLKKQRIDPHRIVYYGESLGTGVAVQMATEVPPKALILEAPFTSVTDIGAFYYPFLPVRRLAKYRFDSLSKVQSLTMPVMIYHGEHDHTVPYRFGNACSMPFPANTKCSRHFLRHITPICTSLPPT